MRLAGTPARVATDIRWDEERRVWRLADGESIPYVSDAYAAEHLEPVLRGATDLSSLSAELHAHGQGWPASYYLNIGRTNLLRCFDWPADGSALEVGAGCGTLTRLLGERFAEVVAVEGEAHRAALASLRTRGQEHVTVLNAPFERLELAQGFDVVFCVGVLEYAPAFGTTPEAFTARLADAVAPGGTLVLAIENKLGLKYFAGAAEDHTGTAYDGLEGYHRSGRCRAVTPSRREIVDLLAAQGLDHVEVYLPFPDYKLPRCIVAPSAAAAGGPALAGLVAHGAARSHTPAEGYPRFSQVLAWRELVAAGLLPELANSFLVLASRGAPSRPAADWDAVAFSPAVRRAEFLTLSTVRGLGADRPEVERTRLIGRSAVSTPTLRLAPLPARAPWVDRDTVGRRILEAGHQAGATPASLAAAAQPWIVYLRDRADSGGRLDGSLVDAIPGNLTAPDGDGTAPVFFDREIVTTRPVRLNVMLVRGLSLSLGAARAEPGGLAAVRHMTLWGLIRATLREAGVRVGLRDLAGFARLEAAIQHESSHLLGTSRDLVVELMLNPVGEPGHAARLRLLARRAKRLARRLAG